MLKLKKRFGKLGIALMLTSSIFFGSASLVSAEVIPVSCSPTADGGVLVVLYDTVTEMYAAIVMQ